MAQPKKKPPLTVEEANRQNRLLQKKRAGTAGGGTAADRARIAGRGGGLTGMAKKAKASRRALRPTAKTDAHVQEYFRWKRGPNPGQNLFFKPRCSCKKVVGLPRKC